MTTPKSPPVPPRCKGSKIVLKTCWLSELSRKVKRYRLTC